MELDPTRWLISLAGFLYDWMISREWKSILLGMLPLLLLTSVVGLVWVGSHLDREELSAWYVELGDREIAAWEQTWAPSDAASRAAEVAKLIPAALEPGVAISVESTLPAQREVSRFAEVLFRRVELLEPSNRSRFVIGATFAQRGAVKQAEKTLTKIAPSDRSGYAPAHAFLTLIYIQQYQRERKPELLSLIKHHSKMAAAWPRAPEEVLKAGSDIHWLAHETSTALRLFQQAAERNPDLYLQLTMRAKEAGNFLMEADARGKSEQYLLRRLAISEVDHEARAALAQLYVSNDSDAERLERAEQLLRELPGAEQSPTIARALSEVYRLRFKASLQQVENRFSADIELLDKAMRLDASNPRVVEEVAWLSGIDGVRPNDELIAKLQQFLAEGQATAVTHDWLARTFLLRDDYERAIPHLEQVIRRLPNATDCLNNLAYVLADKYPERLREALELSQRAVNGSTRDPNPDYFDTLGIVYAKLAQTNDAIAAFESAISLAPERIDFHRRVAEQYRLLGQEQMAATHAQVIAAIENAQLSGQPTPTAAPPTPAEIAPAETATSETETASGEPSTVSEPGDSPL